MRPMPMVAALIAIASSVEAREDAPVPIPHAEAAVSACASEEKEPRTARTGASVATSAAPTAVGVVSIPGPLPVADPGSMWVFVLPGPDGGSRITCEPIERAQELLRRESARRRGGVSPQAPTPTPTPIASPPRSAERPYEEK